MGPMEPRTSTTIANDFYIANHGSSNYHVFLCFIYFITIYKSFFKFLKAPQVPGNPQEPIEIDVNNFRKIKNSFPIMGPRLKIAVAFIQRQKYSQKAALQL